MEEMKMKSDLTNAITKIVIAGFGTIVVGAAATPAIIAFWINVWQLLLLYPVALVGIILTSLLFSRNK